MTALAGRYAEHYVRLSTNRPSTGPSADPGVLLDGLATPYDG